MLVCVSTRNAVPFLLTVLSSHCVSLLGDLSRESDNPRLQVPLGLHRVCRGGVMGYKGLVYCHGFLAGDPALPGASAPLERAERGGRLSGDVPGGPDRVLHGGS